MEIWDGYKKDGTLIGHDLIRGEAIADGVYHLVCEILVQHVDGSYLLMQRDYNKASYPGLYEATAGGSVIKGENEYHAAVRELEEETGIVCDKLDKIYDIVGNHAIYKGYYCKVDIDKTKIRLQEEETISYIWVEEEDFLKYIQSDQYVPTHRERLLSYLNNL